MASINGSYKYSQNSFAVLIAACLARRRVLQHLLLGRTDRDPSDQSDRVQRRFGVLFVHFDVPVLRHKRVPRR